MDRDLPRPFLILRDADGQFSLTVRDIRYNSQGYPIVIPALQSERFKTAAAAKNWARDHFQAKAGQYALK
jgi:hypothetical protein